MNLINSYAFSKIPDVMDVLVVAGGGGGGAAYGGGGGAGGLLYSAAHSVTRTAYSVTVGASGAGSSSVGANKIAYLTA